MKMGCSFCLFFSYPLCVVSGGGGVPGNLGDGWVYPAFSHRSTEYKNTLRSGRRPRRPIAMYLLATPDCYPNLHPWKGSGIRGRGCLWQRTGQEI